MQCTHRATIDSIERLEPIETVVDRDQNMLIRKSQSICLNGIPCVNESWRWKTWYEHVKIVSIIILHFIND